MSNIIRMPAADGPELDIYVGNRDLLLLRYYEPEPGVFIAEGRNVVDIALHAGYEPLSAVVTARMLRDDIVDRLGSIPVYVVEEKAARERFGYVLTGGICCAMRRRENPDWREIIRDARRIVVLENVENPTNVGAIFRSAAAMGIDAVLLSPRCVDPLYRRALRVSVGTTCLIPWAFAAKNESEWLDSGIAGLREHGFKTVAMALRDDDVTIDAPVLKSCPKLAIVMGNEGYGLEQQTIDACDYVARIPMMNGVDSLNVAVAAGLAMWELGRQK